MKSGLMEGWLPLCMLLLSFALLFLSFLFFSFLYFFSLFFFLRVEPLRDLLGAVRRIGVFALRSHFTVTSLGYGVVWIIGAYLRKGRSV